MKIRRATSQLFFLLVCCAALIGCRFIQSQLQQKSQSQAGPFATIGGQTVTLGAELARHDRANRQFDLAGTLSIRSGNLPDGLEIQHFSLRPAKAGYYVQNFQRDKNGRWIYLGPSAENVRNLTASTKQEPGALILNFLWANLGGIFNSSAPYETVDVSVTLRDSTGTRYILSLPAVPTTIPK